MLITRIKKIRYYVIIILFSFFIEHCFINTTFADSVEITGISGDALKNVQAVISETDSLTIRKNKITLALEPFGYFHPNISYQTVNINHKRIGKYAINPGVAIRIHDITLNIVGDGKNNIALKKFISKFPLQKNSIFDTVKYDRAKSKLFTIATNQGYINATFKNKLLINPNTNSCSINIKLVSGKKYYYGDVTFVSSVFSTDFLNRFVTFNKNQPFSSSHLLKLQQAMENSYYFDGVTIQPDLTNINQQHIPIKITTHSKKPVRYALGIGYGTLSGARLLAALSLRQLNNEGHHFEGQLRVSSLMSGISANYYIPGANPLTETWVIGENYKMFLPRSGESHSITVNTGYLYKNGNIQTATNLNTLIEKFYIKPNAWQNAHLLYPSFNYNYLLTNDTLKPTYGFNMNLNLSAANQHLLSTTSYAQMDLRLKGLYSIGDFGRIILRGELGLSAIHDLSSFPLSMRFFAGGINSIRGFADSSIGPGKYLQLASVEYQQKIKGNIYGAIFLDTGRATNHFDTPFNRGAGVGLVYLSPIGPLKVYLAQAISKSRKPYSVEFSVGPEFS